MNTPTPSNGAGTLPQVGNVSPLNNGLAKGDKYGDDGRDFNGMPKNMAAYQPTGTEKARLVNIQTDIETGDVILNTPYLELDNNTISQAFYNYYRSFIGFTKTHASVDPESDWQTYLHKPIIANKAQVFTAQVAAQMISPYYTAVDDTNEIAQGESNVIQALGDMLFTDPDFALKIVRAVTCATYMPYVIVKKYFDGKKHCVKICDMTTFKYANFYEPDIQNQRFIIEDELIDFFDAEALYGKTSNWKYVTPGADVYYDTNSQVFLYRNDGISLRNMVRRRTYYNRAHNLELTMVNGIMVSDPNQKLRRLGVDKGRPYPFATLIYENFGRDTIAGRPMAMKLWGDERLSSMMQSMLYDMTKQAVTPTAIVYGSENMTARLWAPGTVINAGANQNFKIETPMQGKFDLESAYKMLQYLDGAASENSNIDPLRSGVAQKNIPARNAVIASQNAEIASLGTFIKNMEKFMHDFGLLTMDDIFQFNIGKDIDKVTKNIGWKSSMIVPSEEKGGAILIRQADNNYANEEEKVMAELELAVEAEKKGYKTIYQINPDLYKDIDYVCQVSVQRSQNKNKEVQKALAMEYHQIMSSNPTYDLYEGTKQVTKFFYPEKVNDLVKKPQENPMQPAGVTPNQQRAPRLPTTNQMLNNTVDTAAGV